MTTTELLTPAYRVRIERDDDAENPRLTFEQTSHVITVDANRSIPVDEDFGPLADQWRSLEERYARGRAMAIFVRYAQAVHGATVLLDTAHYDGARAIWYLLPEDVNLAYAPEGLQAYAMKILEAERTEYRAWARGEVLKYVIERLVTWSSPELGTTRQTWELVEEHGGYESEAEAEREAQQAIDALTTEPEDGGDDESDAPSPRVAQVPEKVWQAVVAGPGHLKNIVEATSSDQPDWNVTTLVGDVVITVTETVRAVDDERLAATLREMRNETPARPWEGGWNSALDALLKTVETRIRERKRR
ncbi:hypothetical protein [Saccharothrix sp. HUAS TT1]|uniref:hypothetical protein n=1 Tax=unclassified Saccharothrix TaxID=2593673 RepID=UPI00345B6299